jgi:hypothetical protein
MRLTVAAQFHLADPTDTEPQSGEGLLVFTLTSPKTAFTLAADLRGHALLRMPEAPEDRQPRLD